MNNMNWVIHIITQCMNTPQFSYPFLPISTIYQKVILRDWGKDLFFSHKDIHSIFSI